MKRWQKIGLVAAAALDVWAHEHGYMKIELNLVGL